MLPLVAIIIPVGPAHRDHVGVALASCMWQSTAVWHAFVINDSPLPLERTYGERVTVIETGGGFRAAATRNLGIAEAKRRAIPFVLCLDADDYLLPDALTHLLRGHLSHDRAYTYADHYSINESGEQWSRNHIIYDYDQQIYARFNLHPISALVPTAYAAAVGGFDEQAEGWEDWTYFLRLAQAGYCGGYVRQPVFVYRTNLSQQHHIDNQGGAALMERIRQRYRNSSGEITFMACGCGRDNKQIVQDAILGGAIPEIIMAEANGAIVLEYIGDAQGAVTFRAPSGRSYKAGANTLRRYLSTAQGLNPDDIPHLLSLGVFKRAAPVAPFVPPPVPLEGVAKVIDPVVEPEEVTIQSSGAVAIPTPARRKRAQQGAA